MMDTLILLVALVLALLFLRHLRMMPESYIIDNKANCQDTKKREINRCCTQPAFKRSAEQIACCGPATSRSCN